MMNDVPRWLEDARIPERMHAQGLPLDMMLSVDRGSDAVVLRVTTRHLSREEARELGSRLIEAGEWGTVNEFERFTITGVWHNDQTAGVEIICSDCPEWWPRGPEWNDGRVGALRLIDAMRAHNAEKHS